MDAAAPALGQHLHLDVMRPFDRLLEDQSRLPEPPLRLAPGALEGRAEPLRRPHDAHTASAAAARGLYQDRIADPVRLLPKGGLVLVSRPLEPRDDRDAGAAH